MKSRRYAGVGAQMAGEMVVCSGGPVGRLQQDVSSFAIADIFAVIIELMVVAAVAQAAFKVAGARTFRWLAIELRGAERASVSH